jgi:hypothetical protein
LRACERASASATAAHSDSDPDSIRAASLHGILSGRTPSLVARHRERPASGDVDILRRRDLIPPRPGTRGEMGADEEAFSGIMQRFFSILSEGIEHFEGFVDKFTGDGITRGRSRHRTTR